MRRPALATLTFLAVITLAVGCGKQHQNTTAVDPPTTAKAVVQSKSTNSTNINSASIKRCRKLAVTDQLQQQLAAIHLKKYDSYSDYEITGPANEKGRKTSYGRCTIQYVGTVRYALGYFKMVNPQLDYTDQPEVFIKYPGGEWQDIGDGGFDACEGRVPPQLTSLWHDGCSS